MAIYSSAVWEQGNSGGPYLGGPVAHCVAHHRGDQPRREPSRPSAKTTPGPTLRWTRRPCTSTSIQMSPQGLCGTLPGGVQTNRWHAVQIELVAQGRPGEIACPLGERCRFGTLDRENAWHSTQLACRVARRHSPRLPSGCHGLADRRADTTATAMYPRTRTGIRVSSTCLRSWALTRFQATFLYRREVIDMLNSRGGQLSTLAAR